MVRPGLEDSAAAMSRFCMGLGSMATLAGPSHAGLRRSYWTSPACTPMGKMVVVATTSPLKTLAKCPLIRSWSSGMGGGWPSVATNLLQVRKMQEGVWSGVWKISLLPAGQPLLSSVSTSVVPLHS